MESFWNPNVYVDNAVEPPTVKSDKLRLMMDKRHRGYLAHSLTLKGVFYVRMGLPDFPFDIQVCSAQSIEYLFSLINYESSIFLAKFRKNRARDTRCYGQIYRQNFRFWRLATVPHLFANKDEIWQGSWSSLPNFPSFMLNSLLLAQGVLLCPKPSEVGILPLQLPVSCKFLVRL